VQSEIGRDAAMQVLLEGEFNIQRPQGSGNYQGG